MSSQLNTLDHEIMSLVMKAAKPVSLKVLVRETKVAKNKVTKSVEKLLALNFVRRVKCGAESLYAFVHDSLYFPPVHAVDNADVGGGVFSYDDPELELLVAECDKNL